MAVLIEEGFPKSAAVHGPGGRRYSRYFTVEAVSEADAENLLEVHKGIRRGVPYTNWRGETPDFSSVCQSVSPVPLTQVPETGSGLFAVTVDYDYVSRVVRPPQTLLSPPRLWVEETLVSVPADVDVNGNPIANTAKEIYDPPPTVTVVQQTLIAEWTRAAPNWLAAYNAVQAHLNKTNSSPFKGGPAQCVKCTKMRVDENATPYIIFGQFLFKHRAEFQFAPEVHIEVPNGATYDFPGWHVVRRNIGRRIINTSLAGGYIQIREGMAPGQTSDRSQPFVTDPVDIGSTGSDLSFTARYRAFQMFETIDHNALGI